MLPNVHQFPLDEANTTASGFVDLQSPAATSNLETPWTLELDLPGGGRLRIQSGLVRDAMIEAPLSGSLFVFVNRRGFVGC